MTETYVTTAEQELRSLQEEIARRLARIEWAHDGWRARCLKAEKNNKELIDELCRVRDELRDLKYAGPRTQPTGSPLD